MTKLGSKLTTYVCRHDERGVRNFLQQNGCLMNANDMKDAIVISVEENLCSILGVMLRSFENNHLNRHKERSVEYSVCKHGMKEVLRYAIDDENLSKEMQQVLSSYIDFSEEDTDLEDLGDSFKTSYKDANYIVDSKKITMPLTGQLTGNQDADDAYHQIQEDDNSW